MGLWQILKGEQPGLLKSVLHYRNAGQFGEYLIDYALQSNGIEGERVVLTNLYLPMKGKTTEIDLLMLHEKGIFVIESKYYSGWIFGSEDQLKWTQCFRNGRKEHFYVCISALDEFICFNYTTLRVLFPYRKGKGQTANELRDLVHLIPKKLEIRTLLGIELQKVRTKTASPPKIA